MAKFNHTAHKELWDWLAKNPEKGKADWPGWEFYCDSRLYYWCFACEYARNEATGKGINPTFGIKCQYCPLIWNDDDDEICMDGLFDDWDAEKDLQKRTKLAEQIRDLSVREGVECI